MLRFCILAFVSLALALTLPRSASAEELSSADKGDFQRIISEQISAFNADDAPRAYSHAAPMIRQIFPTPDTFMAMVKKGYAPVYRQKSFEFGDVTTEFNGQPTQRVTIMDMNGKLWTALYAFQKQPDGSWKINGCMLVEMPGADV